MSGPMFAFERWAARIGSAMLASAIGIALAVWLFVWWSA